MFLRIKIQTNLILNYLQFFITANKLYCCPNALKAFEMDKTLKLKDNINLLVSTKDALDPNSACFLLETAGHVFNNEQVITQALEYIERWFCLIMGEQKHLELSFKAFIKGCVNFSDFTHKR